MKEKINISGILLFCAGIIMFMGVIAAEIFYPPGYSTRNSPMSGLGGSKPPPIIVMQPSATIFNTSMIVAGILIIISSLLIYKALKKRLISISLLGIGLGVGGLGTFSCISFTIHYSSSVLLFLSSPFFVFGIFRLIKGPVRYIYLLFAITILCFDFGGTTFINLFGKGGAERLAIYPILFCLTGFGTYLIGLAENYILPSRASSKTNKTIGK